MGDLRKTLRESIYEWRPTVRYVSDILVRLPRRVLRIVRITQSVADPSILWDLIIVEKFWCPAAGGAVGPSSFPERNNRAASNNHDTTYERREGGWLIEPQLGYDLRNDEEENHIDA